MSIEETKYFRQRVIKWDKDLLKAQDWLMRKFEQTGDSRQLRKDFYDLRRNYLHQCLTAYAGDLEDTPLEPEQHRAHLLQTKLAFYVTRFADDMAKLFPKNPLRNAYTVVRFARTGNKLVAHLVSTE